MMWKKLVLEIHLAFPCPLLQVKKEIDITKRTAKHLKTQTASHQTGAPETPRLQNSNKPESTNRFPSKLLPLFLQQTPNILLMSQNEPFVHSVYSFIFHSEVLENLTKV